MDFRSDLDALTLGTLTGGPMHGYEIMRRINARGEDSIRIKEGQLYPILHRLESEGRIVAEWEPQEGKPARKNYRLTEEGHRLLEKKRQAWASFVTTVNALLDPMKEVRHGAEG